MNLHTSSPALPANAGFKKLVSTADDKIYAYTRFANNSKVLVVLNLSANAQSVTINDNTTIGEATELFSNQKMAIKAGHSFALAPWGYQVYSYQ